MRVTNQAQFNCLQKKDKSFVPMNDATFEEFLDRKMKEIEADVNFDLDALLNE